VLPLIKQEASAHLKPRLDLRADANRRDELSVTLDELNRANAKGAQLPG
jgi:hypothetical protein